MRRAVSSMVCAAVFLAGCTAIGDAGNGAPAQAGAHPDPRPDVAVAPTWTEDFERLDPSRWQVQLFSFPANGCNMVADHVDARDGALSLLLTLNQATDPALPKLCNSGEIGSTDFFTYGLFVTRMRAPAVRGSVTAFFLMNQWVAQDWEHQEIDIEILGRNTRAAQYTNHDFQNGGRDWKSASDTVDLGFDASLAFHEYAILWTDAAVVWYVDGKRVHKESRYVPHVPLQIRMNTYLGDPATPGVSAWLGPLDTRQLPASAAYRRIEYYPLTALPARYVQ